MTGRVHGRGDVPARRVDHVVRDQMIDLQVVVLDRAVWIHGGHSVLGEHVGMKSLNARGTISVQARDHACRQPDCVQVGARFQLDEVVNFLLPSGLVDAIGCSEQMLDRQHILHVANNAAAAVMVAVFRSSIVLVDLNASARKSRRGGRGTGEIITEHPQY